MNINYQQFIQDFMIGNRRLGERSDIAVELKFTDPSEGIADLPAVLEKMRGVGRGLVSILTLPEGFARLTIVSARQLLYDEEQKMFYLLGRLVRHFEREGRGRISPDPIIGRSLKEFRESLGVSTVEVARLLHIRESAFSTWESGNRTPRALTMYRWCQALGLVCRPKTALVRVVEVSPELLRFLQDDPARMRLLTPEQFERFVAERLDRMGFNVTLTGPTTRKDGGIDLIAVPRLANLGSIVIAGQVKHHRGNQKTGREAVDRLLAWKDSPFGVGLLVTNTNFTRDALWTAQRERNAGFLRLRDFVDLRRWLEGHFGSEEDWRDIPGRIELAPGIVIEIPRPRIISSFDLSE